MNPSPNSFAVTSGCIIAGLILLVFIYLLYRFYRFLFTHRTIFGSTLKTRIISLGITTLFFSTGITMIFFHPAEILFQCLMNFYSGINDVKANHEGGFGNVLTNIFSSVFGNLNQQFQDFRIGPAIVAIAAWSLIGQLVDSYSSGMSTEAKSKDKALRQNIILGLVFILSIYLSFAAIITVPYFTETTQPNESKEEFLKIQLDEIQKNSDAKATLMVKPEAPEFEIDTTIFEKIGMIPNMLLQGKVKERYREAKVDYINSIKSRKNAFEGLEKEKVKYNNRLAEEATRMLAIYSTESPNLKSQLRIAFRNSLVEHYKGVAEVSYIKIEEVNDGIWYADEKFRKDLRQFEHDFTEFVSHAAGADSLKATLPNELSAILDLNSDYYFADDLYLSSADYLMAIPAVPSPGDDLGIFKDIAQWLIKPLSMALVLIVGMLGFGLFGSVISTFVKEAKEPSEKDGVIIKDVTGVIIRGVSAAIVIFLGVKGGLAIFSTGESEPNPYALFFTCLVGAVYSEKIWDWAKEKLSNNFKTEGDPTTPVTPSDDTPQGEQQ
jgi:hypothetical protein